ncbi:MAG: cation:proton antiporter, partial [Acidobacteriota bacterium]
LAGFLLAFGLISGRLQKSIVTAPMVFVAFGLLFGPLALGIIRLDVESEVIRTIAEATLILVLFTDASRIDLRILRREYHIPVRLLAFGLPLTILLGTLLAVVLFDGLSLWEAAIVAAILAPTDAALGQAVVGSPAVPVRMRQALNVESGLNDGIALPFVMIFLSLAGAAQEQQSAGAWIGYAALQIIMGPLVGVAVGWGGGRLVSLGTRTGWMSPSFQRLSALALAFLAYAGAEQVGGNGFIAAFFAGLALGNAARPICTCLYEFAEAEGQLLTLVAFLVFGAASVMPALEHVSVAVVLFAVLSLTVVRMIPVSISLLGRGLGSASHLFLGWFGPRGLASILYVMLVLEGVALPGRDLIFSIVILTVVLSVFVHGITAYPGANWYAARTGAMRHRTPDCPELAHASDMRVRLPMSGE